MEQTMRNKPAARPLDGVPAGAAEAIARLG